MFEIVEEVRPRSYSDDFLLETISLEDLKCSEYATQQEIPEDRWVGYNEFSQVQETPPQVVISSDHPDAWMLSVTEEDWAQITESIAEEQRIQKMERESLLLPISNAMNAKKRTAAMNFVNDVFSSRNLRRKTHIVRDAWEGSEKALESEINAILKFIQENSQKMTS